MPERVSLSEVAALAARLPPAECRQLAETILRQPTSEGITEVAVTGRFWREIRGSIPWPLCGEDAQVWVSRSRRDSDDQFKR